MGRLNRIGPSIFRILVARKYETEQNPASDRIIIAKGWLLERFPKIASMAEPFSRQQLLWMFRKWDVEDIRRLVATMDNKGAWKNRSAFCTFTSYAARDHELLTHRQAEAECGRLYTYQQMVQMLPTNGGRYRAEDFETVQTPQGVRWRIRWASTSCPLSVNTFTWSSSSVRIWPMALSIFSLVVT